MAFDRNSGKAAGESSSRKGISNKSTAKIRDKIVNVIQENLESLEADLNALNPKERLDVLLKLMNYSLPKIKAIEAGEHQGFDEMEIKLIAAMEHSEQRALILKQKIKQAEEEKERRERGN